MAAHVVRTGVVRVALPPERAFLLFTPEGEVDWVPGWRPVMHHPTEGPAGVGAVFTTEHGGEHTIWTVAERDPAAFRMAYVRLTPGSRLAWVRVEGEALREGGTAVRVTYEVTALTPAGERTIAAMTPEQFTVEMAQWQEAIRALLVRA